MNTQEIKRITHVPALCEYDDFVNEEQTWKTIHYMAELMKQTFDKIKLTTQFKQLGALFDAVVKNMPDTSVVIAKHRSGAVCAPETYQYPMISSAYPSEDETTKIPQCLVPYGNNHRGYSIDKVLHLICRDDGEGIRMFEDSMNDSEDE